MRHRQAMISDQPKPTNSTFLANLKIGTKLLLGFGAVLLTAVGLGLFAIQSLEAVNEAAMDVRDNWLPSTVLVTEMQSALQDFRIAEARHVMAATDAERDSVEAELKVLLDRTRKLRADYDPLVTPGEERGYVTSFDRDWSYYQEGGTILIELSRKDDSDNKAEHFFAGELRQRFLKTRKSLADDVALNVREGKKAANQGAEIYASARLWIIGALIAAALLCATIGIAVGHGITRPIMGMTETMRRLAKHDMAAVIAGLGRKDEIGAMAEAVQVFKDSMIEGERLAAAQAAENEVRHKRTTAIEALITDCDGAMASILRPVAPAASQLDSTAQSM